MLSRGGPDIPGEEWNILAVRRAGDACTGRILSLPQLVFGDATSKMQVAAVAKPTDPKVWRTRNSNTVMPGALSLKPGMASLFDDEPALPAAPAQKAKASPAKSGASSLFDDDAPSPPAKAPLTLKAGTSSLFDDEPATSAPQPKAPLTLKSGMASLFDDDEPAKPPAAKTKATPSPKKAPGPSLFSEQPPAKVAEHAEPASAKAVPKSAASLFDDVPLPVPVISSAWALGASFLSLVISSALPGEQEPSGHRKGGFVGGSLGPAFAKRQAARHRYHVLTIRSSMTRSRRKQLPELVLWDLWARALASRLPPYRSLAPASLTMRKLRRELGRDSLLATWAMSAGSDIPLAGASWNQQQRFTRSSAPPNPGLQHTDKINSLNWNMARTSRMEEVMMTEMLHRLRSMSRTNLHLAICSLVYVGINICTTILNSMDLQFREEHEQFFHFTEFWATFCFALIQVYALVGCPRDFEDIFSRSKLVKLIMALNVVSTVVPAVLITASLERFEVIAHEIEYVNEITMALVDFVFLYSMAKKAKLLLDESMLFNLVVTGISMAIAIMQLCIYNGLPGAQGEQLAHYFEFAFESFSGLISFVFCMDCKFECDQALLELCESGLEGKGARQLHQV
ncbi:CSN8 [Symbiodinium sp. CCMP2456]|nr:CSN8 [Symbiodinium sp. CCMP2456]